MSASVFSVRRSVQVDLSRDAKSADANRALCAGRDLKNRQSLTQREPKNDSAQKSEVERKTQPRANHDSRDRFSGLNGLSEFGGLQALQGVLPYGEVCS